MESFNASKYQGTLKLIPFISPSEDNEAIAIKLDTLNKNELSGKEVSEFYESIISTPSIQESKRISPSHKLKKYKKSLPVSTKVNVPSDAIFRFAQEGDVEKIRQFVSSGYSIDQQDAYGWTPLMCATCEGHYDVVSYLLQQGANPSIQCKSGMTPLDVALKIKNDEIINLLRTGIILDKPSPCSSTKQSVEEKFCESCKIHYQVSTNTHERSIAHLFNSKKTNRSTFYHIPENNKGFQIMLKKGWDKDKGLGINAEGRKYPIKTVLKKDRGCIGRNKETAKVTHFDANNKEAVKSIKYAPVRTVRERTLNKRQRKRMENISRQKEINFRRQFNCEY